jgi:hypothetical protein
LASSRFEDLPRVGAGVLCPYADPKFKTLTAAYKQGTVLMKP